MSSGDNIVLPIGRSRTGRSHARQLLASFSWAFTAKEERIADDTAEMQKGKQFFS